MRAGQTIGEKREKLETSSERVAAHKKIKKKKYMRVFWTCALFFGVIGLTYYGIVHFLPEASIQNNFSYDDTDYNPSVEIIDEDIIATGGTLSSRMKTWIGQAEVDFRALGYVPVKVIIPTGMIREVDFYLDGHVGRIKMSIDRGSAVSVEDADRMIRYLTGAEITEFEYIDVRTEGKGYWK